LIVSNNFIIEMIKKVVKTELKTDLTKSYTFILQLLLPPPSESPYILNMIIE